MCSKVDWFDSNWIRTDRVSKDIGRDMEKIAPLTQI